MAIKTANDLFIDELKDAYSAEKQAVRVYPRLAKVVSSPELKEALQTHLEETKGQIERLDRVFEILEKRSSGKTCEGMKGLIEEAMQHAEEIEEEVVRDSALIAAAQRMEHYEIASYGTLVAFAKAIGEEEIVELLTETLEQEKATDEKLTSVSETVNEQAISASEDDAESSDDEEGEAVRSKAQKKSANKSKKSARK
jgi:ferritin-like metal-binding protein YciE